jgi:hypothetical protein
MDTLKVSLEREDIFMIIEALESYQIDIEHASDNGHDNYPYDENQVENLICKLDHILDKSVGDN